MSRHGAASLVLGFVLASWLGAAAAQAPPAAAQAPTPELSLEQFLAQRGWSAVQLRENEFGQLEAEVLVNGAHRLRMQVSTSFSKTIVDEAVAKQLGLAIEPSGIEITGAKKQRLGTLRLASLAFGETSVGAATVFTADLPSLLNRAGGTDAVQGVMGSDLLTKYQAVLEIPTTKLYLRVR
jgi:hypothetical protein